MPDRKTSPSYKLILLAGLILIGQAVQSEAKDFGVHGALFAIEEPSITETIKTRLGTMMENGGWDAIRQDMQDRTRGYVNRPRPVLGIERAEQYAAYEVDLTIRLDRDLSDHRGQVFARAGTMINPLGYSQFNKRLAVIDGDDPDQVAFALTLGSELDVKLILINGDPLALMRQHGRRFWFDQDGVISNRFDITRVPSVVTRQDPVMLVEEIPVPVKALEAEQ